MKIRPAARPGSDRDLVALRAPVSRIVRARVADPDLAEDFVQETLARIWEVRWRLEKDTLAAYAITVARNLITTHERADAVHARRSVHVAAHPVAEDSPEAAAVEAEERAALAAALAKLAATDRDLLVAHEVEDTGVDKLAAERGMSAGAVAARLARARARLRVEYLLTVRRITLPTRHCRPVLDALSLGDRRRQAALHAGEHLVRCSTCGDLARPLLERRRVLAWVMPIAALVALAKWLRDRLQTRPGQTAAIAAVMVVATVGLVAVVRPDANPSPPANQAAPAASGTLPSSPPIQPAGTLSASGQQVLPDAAATLQRYIGQRATAVSVRVDAVPADEGFWVGAGPGQRSWVHLVTRTESPEAIRAGMQISFTGNIERVPPDWPAKIGLTDAEGASELTEIGAYVAVSPTELVFR